MKNHPYCSWMENDPKEELCLTLNNNLSERIGNALNNLETHLEESLQNNLKGTFENALKKSEECLLINLNNNSKNIF